MQMVWPFVPVLVAGMIVIIMGIFLFVSYSSYSTSHDAVDRLKTEVDDLQGKANVIKTNSNLTKEQIDNFNQTLTQLIPEQEDFFTILYALEKISIQTKFMVVRYEISPSKGAANKVPLVIDGDGDSDAFINFLKQYPYAGGRFITIEKLEYTPNQAGRIRVSLNFYNQKTITSNTNLSLLSPKDITLMKDIQAKTAIIIKNAPENINYTKKADPFSGIEVSPTTPTLTQRLKPTPVSTTSGALQ